MQRRVSPLAAAMGRIMRSRWSRRMDDVARSNPSYYSPGRNHATYYDSQSGRHVSVHDESKITAYLRSSIVCHEEGATRVDVRDAFLKLMDDVVSMGASGSILTLSSTPSYVVVDRLLDSLGDIAPSAPGDEYYPTMIIRLPNSNSLHVPSSLRPLEVLANLSLCYKKYTSWGAIRFTRLADAGRTSIGIFDPRHYIDGDPISVASGVANVIDAVESDGSSSIPYIVLDPDAEGGGGRASDIRDDDYVRLCEEISYLDVAGPTMKSRLVVSATNVDRIGACLDIGISKYIVDGVECLEVLRDVVDGAGKELVLNNAMK